MHTLLAAAGPFGFLSTPMTGFAIALGLPVLAALATEVAGWAAWIEWRRRPRSRPLSPGRGPSTTWRPLVMNPTRLFCLVLLLTLAGTAAAPLEAQDRDSHPRWSVSTSLTFPLVRIYQIYVNYRIDDRNEISIGPAFQNYRHESFTANAYTLILGYRRYLTDELSVEAEIYPAYNRVYSHVTESYHPGWELWAEAKVGYTWDIAGDRLFLHPAPGIGFGIFQSNPPPEFFDEIESPIFVPQLLVGVRF